MLSTWRKPAFATGTVLVAALGATTLLSHDDPPAGASASAVTARTASGLRQGANYYDGPTGRYLLSGRWRLRRDPRGVGVRGRWYAGAATRGWRPVSVPNAWNARDQSLASMRGEPVWYRRDFRLPDARASLDWLVHFDSVNYRATVWLNGRRIGAHAGSYLPFELRLDHPSSGGVNHLVVRVDNRLRRTDLPPRPVGSGHRPRGGWWNYGGIVRDVYLRRVDRVALSDVQVRPTIACPSCAATVHYALRVRNYSPVAQQVRVQGRYGATPVSIGSAALRPGGSRVFVRDVSIPRPHLWSPGDPYLYPATIDAEAATGAGPLTPAAGYRLLSGIRNVAVSADGRLTVNWRVVDFRGVAVEEDSVTRGSALTIAERNRIFTWMNQLGATELRTQYPLDPYMYEMADRLGILVWSETPVYRVPGPALKLRSVQRRAVAMLRAGIVANGNHPSVFAWSLGNELNQSAPHAQRAYLARAAAAARAADPSRLVAAAISGIPGSGCGSTYAPLDLIGINEYYGWYTGLMGDSDQLSPYLDSVRACERGKAIVVSEFGAEANRPGSAAEKGTYEFQQNFIRTQLGVFASKPWLSGASYFALQDFRVRPQWTGGNPEPQPPWHQKGLVSANGDAKPAFGAVAQIYRATPEFPTSP